MRGSQILVLGVAYKPGVADTRDSPALEILDRLRVKGGRVAYHDPIVPSVTVRGVLLESLDWQWLNSGARDAYPERKLMPSEYIQRQVYGKRSA